MSLFEDMTGYETEDRSPPGLLPIEKSIYDHVIYDSKVERDFAQALEAIDEVKPFVKLPDWFTVPTPIGDYNPDWAIVFHPPQTDFLWAIQSCRPSRLRVKVLSSVQDHGPLGRGRDGQPL
jgi:hypothetical protein